MADPVPEIKTPYKSEISVAIVYYSQWNHTKKIAEHVLKGASKVEGVTVDLYNAKDAIANIDKIQQYDAFIFGSPTYFGSVSAGMKEFFEATTEFFATRSLQDKIAAGFTNSASQSGDKQGTLTQIFTYCCQQGMVYVPLGLPATNNKTVHNMDALNRTSFFSGLATQSFVDGTPETATEKSDLRTAEFFGEKVTRVFVKYYH
ncbi:hypothetical protein DASC09_020640 [Saccharomycopsis crataegensis]|uniref:Flavodoxin-like domain-containing protein n=1 Tax=Saccharomycopsis crataegensis TaxID=43959 RepID=A0AAV5QJZ0_9ASCO|nr:hypothetical protein DASC09_020640 [Saccharomycopsis crataegensis]